MANVKFDIKKSSINTTEIINTIENKVYSEIKPFGFRKHGRTIHRFVDGDISQVINFQCGQAYREETHLMFVNVGIRVPECMLREFKSDEILKKYYHEYECNIRSSLGIIKNSRKSCYNLQKNIEKITDDILKQINKYVLPVFETLNSRNTILEKRKKYPEFDVVNGHLILLEETMIYGKMGDIDTATELYNKYYRKCVNKKEQNVPHIEYLRELADKLNIDLENIK